MSDPTEKLKDDIQNLKDKVTRHEQYFWLAGALAVIFGLASAYGLNAFQTLRQQIEDVHDPLGQYTQKKISEINEAAEGAVKHEVDRQVGQLLKGFTDWENSKTQAKSSFCTIKEKQIKCSLSCDEHTIAVGGFCELAEGAGKKWAIQNFGLDSEANSYHCLWTPIGETDPSARGIVNVLCRKPAPAN